MKTTLWLLAIALSLSVGPFAHADSKSVKEIVANVQPSHFDQVASALKQLKGRGPEIKDAYPLIFEYLMRSGEHTNPIYDECVDLIVESGVAAVPHLQQLLRERKGVAYAARALKNFGSKAQAAIPDLLNVLEFSASAAWIEENVLSALLSMGNLSPEALPYLVKITVSDNSNGLAWSHRQRLVPKLFSSIGPASVPDLLQILKSSNTNGGTAQLAAAGLGMLEIPAEHSEEAFELWLSINNAHVTRLMLPAVAESGEQALSRMLNLASDTESPNRNRAIQALAAFTGQESIVVPLLISLIEKQPPSLAAVSALGSMGPRATAAVPALLRLRDTQNDPSLTYVINNQLEEIGSPDAKQNIRAHLIKKELQHYAVMPFVFFVQFPLLTFLVPLTLGLLIRISWLRGTRGIAIFLAAIPALAWLIYAVYEVKLQYFDFPDGVPIRIDLMFLAPILLLSLLLMLPVIIALFVKVAAKRN